MKARLILTDHEPLAFRTPDGADTLAGLKHGAAVAIFGAGGRGLETVRQLRRCRPDVTVACFGDNGKTGSMENLPICSVAELQERRPDLDAVIIASYWSREITAQLRKAGFDNLLLAEPECALGIFSHYYPKESPLWIERLDLEEDGLLLKPMCDMDGCAAIEADMDGVAITASDTIFALPIPAVDDCPVVTVRGVDNDSAVLASGTIVVSTYETGYENISDDTRQAALDTEYDRIVVAQVNGFGVNPAKRLVPAPPVEGEDASYAAARWGDLAGLDATDLETGMALARDIVLSLRGAPDRSLSVDKELTLAPFAKLEAAGRGEIRVQCGDYAEIFVHACDCLGLKARAVSLQRQETAANARLSIGLGHVACELYCRELEHWVWMDLSNGVLGAEMGPARLNLAQFMMFAHSAQASALKLHHVDTVGKIVCSVFDDSPLKGDRLHGFYNVNHTLLFHS